VASRRAGEQLILEGRVAVNGQVVRLLGSKVDPDHDQVAVDGKVVRPKKLIYAALNKPPGCVCSRKDELNRPTIYQLLPREWETVQSVGRLDYNSEGLIFLTNDGQFALRLTHPRYGVRKKYLASVEGEVTPATLELFKRGIFHEGEKLKALFRHTREMRGGTGTGRRQKPRGAAALRVAGDHGEKIAADADRKNPARRIEAGEMADAERGGN